jgi:hypothetical protein
MRSAIGSRRRALPSERLSERLELGITLQRTSGLRFCELSMARQCSAIVAAINSSSIEAAANSTALRPPSDRTINLRFGFEVTRTKCAVRVVLAVRSAATIRQFSNIDEFGPLRWKLFEPSSGSRAKSARGLLQEIFQIFVELPSDDIDSFVTELSEGRSWPIVLKRNFALGTFPKQDSNGCVKASRYLMSGHQRRGQWIADVILNSLAVQSGNCQKCAVFPVSKDREGGRSLELFSCSVG